MQTYSSQPVISKHKYAVNSVGVRTDVVRSGLAFNVFGSSAGDHYDQVGYNATGEVTATTRYAGTDIQDQTTALSPLDTTYAYDGIGNRTTKEGPVWYHTTAQVDYNYTANQLNQYSTYEIAGTGTWNRTYDADGNVTDEVWTQNTWDAENRLIARAPKYPTTYDFRWAYEYDYRGRRIKQVAEIYDGVSAWSTFLTETFVYDEWNLTTSYSYYSSYTGLGRRKRTFTRGLDLSGGFHGARGAGGLLKINGWHLPDSATAMRYLYLYDGNGNVTELLGELSGDVVFGAHYEYDGFGMVTNSPMPYNYASNNIAWSNPFRVSTKYLASWNWRDLHYGVAFHLSPEYGHYTFRYYDYGLRWYSPRFGRWSNRDSSGEAGGENLYTMVLNSTPNLFDFIGLNPEPIVVDAGRNGCERYVDAIAEMIVRGCTLQLIATDWGGMYAAQADTAREVANYSVPKSNEKMMVKGTGPRLYSFMAPTTDDGLRDEIKKGGQGTAAYRHVGLTAAVVLRHGAIGCNIMKCAGDKTDRAQYESGIHLKEHAEAKPGGNQAGLEAGKVMRQYFADCRCGRFPRGLQLRAQLLALICDGETAKRNGVTQAPVAFPVLPAKAP